MCVYRLGGEEVVWSQCSFALELLESLPQHTPSPSFPLLSVGSLLNRLLALLPAPLQDRLLSAHASSPGSWLWTHLKLHLLHSDTVLALRPHLQDMASEKLAKIGPRQSYHDVVRKMQTLVQYVRCC